MNTCEVQKALLEDLENGSLCGKPATRLFIFKAPAGAASFLRKRFYACDECAAKMSADYVKELEG